MIGSAEVIGSVEQARAAGVPPRRVRRREHRHRRRRATSTTDAFVELLSDRVEPARTAASARAEAGSARRTRPALAVPAQGHGAVPRLSRAPRASRAPTSAATRRRCSTRSSAARHRRGCSRRSARSAGMAYSVYTYASQFVDAGQVGLYVGTREENLRECMEIVAAELRDVAAGQPPPGRARPGEGERQGPAAALARVDVDAHDAARQGARHRGRRSSPSRRRSSASRRSPPDDVVALAGELFAPEGLSAGGHRPERGAVPRGDRARQSRTRSRRLHEGRRLRARREGRVGARAGTPRGRVTTSSTARAGGSAGCDAAVDFTRPDAVLGNVAPCLDARVPVVIGTTGFDVDAVDEAARAAGVPCFHAPNFSLGARPADALRRGGGADVPARRDRRAARRDEDRRALGDGEGDGRADGDRARRSTRCGCRVSSRIRR